jgi:hypothetical protein
MMPSSMRLAELRQFLSWGRVETQLWDTSSWSRWATSLDLDYYEKPGLAANSDEGKSRLTTGDSHEVAL